MAAKTVLVTGSARGLGRRIIEEALAAGWQVSATARTPEDLVGIAGGKALVLALDVTDPAACAAAVERTSEAFGCIDLLVNNAGYPNLASVEDITAEDFRAHVDTNLSGVVNVTMAVLPA